MLGAETSLKSLTSATRTGPASFSTNNKAGKSTVPYTPSDARAEYKRKHCAASGIGIGPRLHSECPFGVVADRYSPGDSEALKRVIKAAYRQVLGNMPPTESQQETSLEARLLNGEINVRDFVNGLAKSTFYKDNFFHAVGAQRGIELTNAVGGDYDCSSEPAENREVNQAYSLDELPIQSGRLGKLT